MIHQVRELHVRREARARYAVDEHLFTLSGDAILPDSGPEVLTGSTRLKAGTTTKLVLNLITTLALARSGKVMSNLMIDLNPSNSKLRGRAIRIVRDLTGADEAAARAALETNGWIIRQAVSALTAKA